MVPTFSQNICSYLDQLTNLLCACQLSLLPSANRKWIVA